MASLDFLHGVEVVEIDDGPRPIQTVKSSVIGLIGSAGKGPINTPVLVAGNRLEASRKFGDWKNDGFTIPEALDAIFDQIGAMVIVVNVCDPAVHTTDIATETKTFAKAGTLQLAKRFVSALAFTTAVVAPFKAVGVTVTLPTGITAVTSVKSADGVTTYVLTTDYTVAGNVITLKTSGAGGSIPADAALKIAYTATLVVNTDYKLDAETGIVTRVATGKIAAQATVVAGYTYVDPTQVDVADIIGGTVSGQYTGVQTFLGSKSVCAITPRILIAPHWTHTKTDALTANPVVAELLGVADRLRSIVIADGPDTTEEDAIQYRGDWGSARIYVVDPWVKVTNPDGDTILQPPSARVAGIIARTDNDLGFWWSPSNKNVNGIIGTSRAIDFTMGDFNSRANYMNANEVATIIREDGYRLWGNRTTSFDPKWAFLNVRRTADMIEESILLGHLWAVDRNISRNFVEEVLEGVNSYIRHLIAVGAILGGKAWANPDLNSPEVLANGQIYIDFDFTASTPAEHITFRAHLVNDYFLEIFDNSAIA